MKHAEATLAKVALGVLLAVEVWDGFRFRSRRMRASTSRWWGGVERREQQKLHEAEFGRIIRHLAR